MNLLYHLALISITTASVRHQNVTVVGSVSCNGEAARNVIVRMKQKDYMTPDDIVSTTHTNENGEFELSGEDYEPFNVSFYVVFYHKCNMAPRCRALATYSLPSDARGGVYKLTIDLGKKDAEDILC